MSTSNAKTQRIIDKIKVNLSTLTKEQLLDIVALATYNEMIKRSTR